MKNLKITSKAEIAKARGDLWKSMSDAEKGLFVKPFGKKRSFCEDGALLMYFCFGMCCVFWIEAV